MIRIVHSPRGSAIGRCSVGELKVHRNGGGSVRYPPALLLDVEHHEGKRRDGVTCDRAFLVRFPPPRVGHGCCTAEIIAVIEDAFYFLPRVSQ